MSSCPCGSNLPYEQCCGPYIAGERAAPTAEALMRSRYTAYSKQSVEYLGETLHPDYRSDHDVNATRRWAAESSWLGLEIRQVSGGKEEDAEGTVEFIATFKDKGVIRRHHERSRFRRDEGRWYYVDGEIVGQGTYVHEEPKVGRNDPCPCGSGKKYKKCCGAK